MPRGPAVWGSQAGPGHRAFGSWGWIPVAKSHQGSLGLGVSSCKACPTLWLAGLNCPGRSLPALTWSCCTNNFSQQQVRGKPPPGSPRTCAEWLLPGWRELRPRCGYRARLPSSPLKKYINEGKVRRFRDQIIFK